MEGEDGFVERLRAILPPTQRVLLGPGDDAALIPTRSGPLLATTDMLVEHVDFLSGEDPEAIGRRALAVNLSDIAAMGGEPEFFLLSVAYPRALGDAFPLAVARGALSRATALDVHLVGGDLSDASIIAVSIALWGRPRGEPLTRSGAKAGDLLFLSGYTGRAAAGLRLARRAGDLSHQAPPTPDERDLLSAYRDPEPRIALGLFLAGSGAARAAIDVSDGLGKDAGRLARASGLRAVLERDRIPLSPALAAFAAAERVDPLEWALGGGDDYEILFASPPESATLVEEKGQSWGVPVRRIGTLEEGSGAVLRGAAGDRDISALGYDHLRVGS